MIRPFITHFRPLTLVMGLAACGLASQALAHGYVTDPPSRAVLCNKAQNTNCGAVKYEPQSVEFTPGVQFVSRGGDKPFPAGGPADGHIASGGRVSFGDVDAQTATRWKKNPIKPGKNEFKWYYTAPHRTTDWRFFITKSGWDVNQPLTRDSFEATPFCEQKGGGQMPDAGSPVKSVSSHTCDVPADRSGYHVILSTWKVDDTAGTFYQVIDVDIDNSEVATPTWQTVGQLLAGTTDLAIGDRVILRAFTSKGEDAARRVELVISKVEDGQRQTWPRLLAEKANAANVGYRVGHRGTNDEIHPSNGSNEIFAKTDGDVVRVEIEQILKSVAATFTVADVPTHFKAQGGKVSVPVRVRGAGEKYEVRAQIFDATQREIVSKSVEVNNRSVDISLEIPNAQSGQYQLVIVATPERGTVSQRTFELTVDSGKPAGEPSPEVGEYAHVFPASVGSYTAGTRVFQPKTQAVYECKPWPVSSWCNNWKAESRDNAYEPGVGRAWAEAWTKVN